MDDHNPLRGTDWGDVLAESFEDKRWDRLVSWLDGERARFKVFPPPEDVLRAFLTTPFHETKVVILGQDPYMNEGQADGLCFSVRPGIPVPPSLKNIRTVLETDQAVDLPDHGSLDAWARRGVLLLNTALTVRESGARSHRREWKWFTDGVSARISDMRSARVVFMLWGCDAQKKAKLVNDRHTIIRSSHPSPQAAHRRCRGSPPFLESHPFSQANEALRESGQHEIDWRLK